MNSSNASHCCQDCRRFVPSDRSLINGSCRLEPGQEVIFELKEKQAKEGEKQNGKQEN